MNDGAEFSHGEVIALLRALYTAASGMMAQQLNIDTVSHNLANVNTTGFKKGRVEFQDLLYTQVQPAARNETAGIAVGQGARLSSIQRIFPGGSLQASGGDFDLAIQGDGFFRVQQADGSVSYTRDGSFRLDAQRRLVTAEGDLLLGAKGPITIPAQATNVEIGMDGPVRYADNTKAAAASQAGNQTAAAQATVVIDRVQLAVFPNQAGMESLGNNLWGATGAAGRPTILGPGEKEAGTLAQGYLEGSNVQAVEEMVNLIMAQRAYEINSKVVQSADEMMGMANSLRRG
jgi:flagellar basal-body rod protein FlgG